MSAPSVQELYAPGSICFGCGPANAKGLKIRSVPKDGDELVCDWTAEPHHEAFAGMVNGGIIGALLDCHSNWTAAVHLMKLRGLDAPPCTVTAEFSVKLLRPTPSAAPLQLVARPVSVEGDAVVIQAELYGGGKKTASCLGKFVAVKPGHPAFHRW